MSRWYDRGMRLARDRIIKDKMFYYRNSAEGIEGMVRREEKRKRKKTEELHCTPKIPFKMYNALSYLHFFDSPHVFQIFSKPSIIPKHTV